MSHSLQVLIPNKFDRWIARDEMSLKFNPKTPPRVFREAWLALMHAKTRVQFYLGDAINFASDKSQRGRYKDFEQESGLEYQTLNDLAWVSSAVAPENRRPELPFSFHKAVAPLAPKDQIRFLGKAIKNSWSVAEFRKQIRLSNLLPGKPAHDPEFGAALDFPGLRRAPINEDGVIFLFGLVSERLGFDVEAVHGAFPDCYAKRLVDSKRNRWKQVKIEFEYASSNFKKHQHQHEYCDLIVCWIHDWSECPTELEVIALKDELSKLRK
jgi:hypothetical protein